MIYPFLEHLEFFNQPIWIDPTNVKLMEEIKGFFQDYPLADIRLILWKCYDVAITTENDTYADPDDRADLLYFYQRIERILEVLYLINQRCEKEQLKL